MYKNLEEAFEVGLCYPSEWIEAGHKKYSSLCYNIDFVDDHRLPHVHGYTSISSCGSFNEK